MATPLVSMKDAVCEGSKELGKSEWAVENLTTANSHVYPLYALHHCLLSIIHN